MSDYSHIEYVDDGKTLKTFAVTQAGVRTPVDSKTLPTVEQQISKLTVYEQDKRIALIEARLKAVEDKLNAHLNVLIKG